MPRRPTINNRPRIICESCGKDKVRAVKKLDVCLKCLRRRIAIAMANGCEHPEKNLGAYVYGWYRENESIPFYIGKGRESRAWRATKPPNTVVKIYRDNLTDEGAMLVESVLISVFLSLGVRLENKSSGRTRVEKPPLIQ